MRAVMAGTVERDEAPGLVALVHRRDETHVAAPGTTAVDGELRAARDVPLPAGRWPDRESTADRTRPPHAPNAWIERLGTPPLVHRPAAARMHRTPADVLGVLIARAAGRPLERSCASASSSPSG
jgi:hypothetical protein